jgi:hypothetical protein
VPDRAMNATDALLKRLERDTLIVLIALTVGALLLRPRAPLVALGVVGGGVLAGLAYWAIRGVVDGVAERGKSGKTLSSLPGFALVKFFTRHAILAVAGYGMMTRLELDPIGLLAGVTTPGIAAAIEAARVLSGPRP